MVQYINAVDVISELIHRIFAPLDDSNPVEPDPNPDPKSTKWDRYYPSGSIIDVSEQHVSESAFTDKPLNLVISEMKTGKSKALIKHLSQTAFSKAVFISFRRTFSAEAAMKYEQLGFKSYSNIEGEIDLNIHKRVIIQVESLFRLNLHSIITSNSDDNNDSHGSILILDEVESIWAQFSSNNFKDYNGSFNVFTLLLKRSDRIIAMDANLGDRTVRLMKFIQPNRDASVYINRYNPNKDYEFILTDRFSWLFKMRDCLKSKEKIAIFTNSLKSAKRTKEFVMNYLDKKRVKIYSSQTKESVKQMHFRDVNTFWQNYDCVICTPTVSAGVSFEAEHFDFVFGDFTDLSCNVETCRQMLGRVRNVGNRQIYITVSTTAHDGKYPDSISQLKTNLRTNRSEIMQMCGEKYNLQFVPYNIDETTCNAIYNDGFQLNVILENLAYDNRSRNYFYNLMQSQLSGEAMGLSALSKVSAESASAMQIKEMKEIYNKVGDTVKNNTIKGIMEAKPITPEQFSDIKDRQSKQSDVESSEHKSVEKFIILQAIKMDESKLSPKLVERFTNKESIRKLKANRLIFAGNSWRNSIDACLEYDTRTLDGNRKAEAMNTYWGNIHLEIYNLAKLYEQFNGSQFDMLGIVTGISSLSEMDPDENMRNTLAKTVNKIRGSLNLPTYDIADIRQINMCTIRTLNYIYGFGTNIKPMKNILYHIKKDNTYYCNGKQRDFADNMPVVDVNFLLTSTEVCYTSIDSDLKSDNI
jgi:hypothetical protein